MGMPLTEAGRALLDDLAPVRTHPVEMLNDLEREDRQAFADRIVAIEQQAQVRPIGVLTYDNGEFDAYCGFFHDPAALRRAVVRLNAERLTEFHDEVDAGALTIPLEAVPAVINDAFLDRLGSLIEDSVGVYIETGDQAAGRREEEAADEEPPVRPVPGQIGLDGSVVE